MLLARQECADESLTTREQLTNWIVGFAMPIFLAKSSFGPYFLFGGFSLLTLLVLAFFLPETRGVSLEDVEGVFQRPLKGWQSQLKRLFGKATDSQSSSPYSGSHSSIELSSAASGVDVASVEGAGGRS